MFFSPNEVAVLGQLVLAACLGLFIGIERVAAGKSAGGRTFALVSLGACLFVVMGDLVNTVHVGVVNFDPMRTAAAVITGIGFLGGGLIFMQKGALQGLTTAAGLWVSAGVGMAVGFKLYGIAVFTSLLTLVVFTLLWIVEDWFRRLTDSLQPLVVGKMIDTDGDSVPDSEEKLPHAPRSEA
ncbi:MAG: MgtC/SapB family protein [Patescibacteria group bacterium]